MRGWGGDEPQAERANRKKERAKKREERENPFVTTKRVGEGATSSLDNRFA